MPTSDYQKLVDSYKEERENALAWFIVILVVDFIFLVTVGYFCYKDKKKNVEFVQINDDEGTINDSALFNGQERKD